MLRSSLALATLTRQPVPDEDRVRAGRAKPGLLRRRLAAVQAAARVSNGRASSASLARPASSSIQARSPAGRSLLDRQRGGAPLVLSTVLPALALADSRAW
ncbi:MAG: RNA 3'-terminal phosphate cyclase [Sandaracinaceae bacterium]